MKILKIFASVIIISFYSGALSPLKASATAYEHNDSEAALAKQAGKNNKSSYQRALFTLGVATALTVAIGGYFSWSRLEKREKHVPPSVQPPAHAGMDVATLALIQRLHREDLGNVDLATLAEMQRINREALRTADPASLALIEQIHQEDSQDLRLQLHNYMEHQHGDLADEEAVMSNVDHAFFQSDTAQAHTRQENYRKKHPTTYHECKTIKEIPPKFLREIVKLKCESCPVCFDDYPPDDEITLVILPCGHILHTECEKAIRPKIPQGLVEGMYCPVCDAPYETFTPQGSKEVGTKVWWIKTSWKTLMESAAS